MGCFFCFKLSSSAWNIGTTTEWQCCLCMILCRLGNWYQWNKKPRRKPRGSDSNVPPAVRSMNRPTDCICWIMLSFFPQVNVQEIMLLIVCKRMLTTRFSTISSSPRNLSLKRYKWVAALFSKFWINRAITLYQMTLSESSSKMFTLISWSTSELLWMNQRWLLNNRFELRRARCNFTI